MDPGQVVLAPVETYGFMDTTVDFLPEVPLQTDMRFFGSSDRKIVLSELNWKNSKTVGSMALGSAVITTSNTAGFAVGDSVIVATGGEASGGQRGSPGVGGYLNDEANLTFTSLAQLMAFTPPNNGAKGFIINPSDPDHGRAVQGSRLSDTDVPAWYVPDLVQVEPGSPGVVRSAYWNLKNGWSVTFTGGTTLPTGPHGGRHVLCEEPPKHQSADRAVQPCGGSRYANYNLPRAKVYRLGW